MNKDLLKALNKPITKLTPAEWGEAERVLSKAISPNHSGPLSYRLTPYLIKIVNSFQASNPAQIISIMKGSQLGISIAGIFTILGWIMAESPANTLFITENDDKIRDQMQGPINQMINSTSLRDRVGAHNIREREAKGRRKSGTGDTMKGIDFGDGRLYTWSGQTVGSLSSWSIRYGVYDEVERWKGVYKNAGDVIALVEPRHRESGNNRKLLFASTPEIKQTSRIEPLYNLGDQQKYMIPCKHCGSMIEIVWSKDVNGTNAGINYERDSRGKYVENSATYVCQECGKDFKEVHKFDMYDQAYDNYKNGVQPVCDWVGTAEPESFFYESYHISSLYSPVGFYSWNDLARKWCTIHPKNQRINIEKLKTFTNQELGLTWEEQGREVDVKHLLKNTRNYDIGTIPNALSIQDGNGRIILITCASDLNGKEDDARMDWEVVAWSENGSSYSIDHGSIGTFQRSRSMRHSSVEAFEKHEAARTKWTYRMNQPNNVWDEFKNTVMSRVYFHEDGVTSPRCPIFGIDTGGTFKKYGKSFVQENPLAYALQGKVDNKYTKYDQIKTFFTHSTKIDGLYLVEGDTTKDYLADQMSHLWTEEMGTDQPSGFMNFPRPEGDKYQYKTYFHEYEGEKRELELNSAATAIGSRWVKKNTSAANHFWDVRCYNIVCREIIADQICRGAKIPISWENFSNLVKEIT